MYLATSHIHANIESISPLWRGAEQREGGVVILVHCFTQFHAKTLGETEIASTAHSAFSQ